jgi:hypothetical protein
VQPRAGLSPAAVLDADGRFRFLDS